tara:strand:- start:52 stop:924 length:873 start_codon:yes stop_codon:yes gene_type:complete
MASIGNPIMRQWGNSGARDPMSDNMLDNKPLGQIDPDKLNRTRGDVEVEFNDFEEIINSFVLARMGHPIIRVELTPFQMKTCIDESITKLNYHAPYWANQMAVFDASAGVNIYALPGWIITNLVNVVYKKSLLSIQAQAGTLEFDFFIKYFNDNYLFNNFSIGDYYLLQSTMEMTRKILGQDGTWDILGGKYLQLYPPPTTTPEPVIIQYRSIDSENIPAAYLNWIQKYTLACAKVLLGEIRSKYAVIPGPAGGAQMNGQALVQEGNKEKELLYQELVMEIEEPPKFSSY